MSPLGPGLSDTWCLPVFCLSILRLLSRASETCRGKVLGLPPGWIRWLTYLGLSLISLSRLRSQRRQGFPHSGRVPGCADSAFAGRPGLGSLPSLWLASAHPSIDAGHLRGLSGLSVRRRLSQTLGSGTYLLFSFQVYLTYTWSLQNSQQTKVAVVEMREAF